MPESFFGWIGFLIKEYGSLFVEGTINTIIIAVVGTLIGFLIGLLIAIVRTIKVNKKSSAFKRGLLKIVNAIITVYIQVIRGTPMMVQAMMFYYGSLQYFNLNMAAMPSALIIVSVNTGAYMAEIIRGGIISVDKGQTEGALSIGMTHWQTMTEVVLPQAVRNIIPSVGNEFIVNIKDSSVLNVISVSELFFISKSAAGTYLRYFEVFFITALIYLVLTITVSQAMKFVEKKMDGDGHYKIYGSQSTAEVIEVEEEVWDGIYFWNRKLGKKFWRQFSLKGYKF